MEQSQKEKYLGGILENDVSRRAELANRLGAAMATAQKLYLFWRHQKVRIKWKIQGYNAVVISQLVYGLNTVYFTESLRNRIDAFHFRGLRAILGIEHSYWSHITNDEVLDRANTILNLKEENL